MACRVKTQAPEFYTWTFPVCPHAVHIDLSVVRALADELAADDAERQGVLLGIRQHGLTHIHGFEALASLDAGAFAAGIGAHGTVVGYYRIRKGCAFILEPTEVELAKSLFSDPGSVVLLVERREAGAAECAFAFWRGDAFVSNLPRPFPLDAAALAAEPARTEPQEPPRDASSAFILRGHAPAIAVIAAAVAGTGVLALIWSTGDPPKEADIHRSVVSTPAPALSAVAHMAGDIEFTWDTRSLSGAAPGLLEIADGGLRHYVSLAPDLLHHGSIVYTPGAGPVRAALKVLLADGGMVEVPVSGGPAPRPAPAAPSAAAVSSAPVRVVAAVMPRALPVPPPPPAPAQKTAVRRFVVETDSPAGRASGGAAVLPDAPVIRTTAPPFSPVVTASLPAPPPPHAVRPVDRPARTGSGRLIWTGTLERRGVVELEGRSASIGSLTGALPGVPVNVVVSPAEFGSNGLVVYTTEARLNGHVESPSAANGWNRINYIWDPERVRQIAVLETPNLSNRFSHLALRSDARRLSLLVIDWTTAQASTTR
jgi:hypothetical protein